MQRRAAAAKRIGGVGGAAGLALLAVATAASAQVEQVRIEGTQDRGRLGSSVATIGDLDGDGCDDWVVGERTADTANGTDTGQVHVISGATGTVLRSHLGSAPFGQLGDHVVALGDVDGDAVPDYAAAAPSHDSSSNSASGRIEAYSGATGQLLWGTDGFDSFDFLGRELCAIDDLDGDGRRDLIAAYLTGTDDVDVYSGATGAYLTTLNTPNQFVTSMARIGDVDGDGRRDFAIGYPFGWITAQNEGYVRIYSGATGAWIRTISGVGVDDGLGESLVGTDDVDQDGVEDFLVGAGVRKGTRDGRIELRSGATLAVLRTIPGATGEQLGNFVGAGGDWDGDGIEEQFATAIAAAPHGSVHVYSGATGAELHVYASDDSAASHDVRFGWSLATGDWNGDGIGDLAIAADGWYGSTGTDRGIVHAFLGCPAAQSNYGVGHPGTFGTPTLSISGDPELGATLTFTADNSRGAKTTGWVLIGDAAASISLKKGGTLLVAPQIVLAITIPASGFSTQEQLPDDPALGFSDFFLQIVELDPGAAGGLSMTQGLQLRLGWDY
ncbi:MAG: FG-GAP repeat protein [Planctomycetes bacterium]|nr:FG-GAP repeat protein [Planctomycetota bacterium]